MSKKTRQGQNHKSPCKCPVCGSGTVAWRIHESIISELWGCECGNPTCTSDYRAGGESREAAIERYRLRAPTMGKGKAAA